MKKSTLVTFKSKQDFRNRIARLWQDQKDDEVYDFVFPDNETKEEFENLVGIFSKGQ